MATLPLPNLLATVDLGSNSFRLEIARMEGGRLQREEYLKEAVRLGSGLDENHLLVPEALQRGWDCLARFGARLRGFAPFQVRAVATQTLREARNRDEFIRRGSALLGFPIDIISGPEEARLVYLGAAHSLPPSDERRLVVDIGGRSTETILGQAFVARTVASFRVGSVSWSARFFADGVLSEKAFERADIAAQAALEEAVQDYPRGAWDTAYGTSGTITATHEILQAMGVGAGCIRRADVLRLRKRMIAAGHIDVLDLPALKDNRRPVIAGGISVLAALFKTLHVEEMHVAQGALRHGALFDMVARQQPETDLREQAVQALMRRFVPDAAQAARVAAVALWCFDQLLNGKNAGAPSRTMLYHAARLHELGCAISEDYYARHGAYILNNTDVTGLTQSELHQLAQLVLGQKGKVHKLDLDLQQVRLVSQLLSLRLARILCHARSDPRLESLRLSRKANLFKLKVPTDWPQTHEEAVYMLEQESKSWEKTAWKFEVSKGR